MASLLETLGSYVPNLLVRYAADPAFPRPTAAVRPAAVLFADVKGFTALTERLAARGPAGAEDLVRLLNAYLGQLVDAITVHGGDVVKFAGDAVVALWEAGTAGLGDAVGRASACALAVQSVLHDYEVAEGIRLSMKLAVGAGDVLCEVLGGVFDRWELLVAGEPLAQLSRANSLAGAGETVLAPSAWATLAGRGRAEELPGSDGYVRLTAVDVPPAEPASRPIVAPGASAAVRAFVPGAIRARIDAGHSDWLAELRRVTVLFVNLPDLTHAMSLERAQEMAAALQTSVYRYEGSINKISVDDKGASLVAAFGLPPLSHEDDPVRAVRAAVALREALARLGHRCSIGVATGLAFCGSVGSTARREYTLMGDVVNLSARLMQAAQGGVLCDRPTAEAAGRRVDFDALEPIHVKGKQDLIPVYRPVAAVAPRAGSDRAEAAPPLVERQREQALLAERVTRLLDGRGGSTVLIEGEPGIGKSLLLRDLISVARSRHVRVLAGAGDSVETSTPYFAMRPIFAALFDLDRRPADPGDWRTYVLDQLPAEPDVLRRAPLLAAVLPFPWPDNEFTAALAGKPRADHTQELLARLLTAAATEAPLVLAVEDAHWLDSGSLAVLHRLAREGRPLLLAVTTRPVPEPLPTEFAGLRTASEVNHLDRLSPEATVALAARALGVRELPFAAVDLIRERAEGNPFFAEELAFALRDTGVLVVEDGACRVAEDAADAATWAVPHTVEGAILSRIDRLTPPQQLTLKVASVIGRVFPSRTLHDIHPVAADRPAILGHFDVLHRLDLTPLERPEPDSAYAFKHVTTYEVAYNLLPYSQRRLLHREAALWYERTYADDLEPWYPLLAFHWRRAAEDREPDVAAAAKAVDYLRRAGDHAARGFLEPEAVRFYGEAIALLAWLPDDPDRARRELELRLAAGALMIGTRGYAAEEVRQAYERARDLCAVVGDRALLFPALRGLWAFRIGRAEFEDAILLSRQLLRLADEDGRAEVRMEAHRAMGNATFWIGDLATARDHMQSAIDLYVENRDRSLALLYGQDPDVANRGMQAWPLSLLGQVEEARQRGEEAVAHARALGHPYSLGYALVHAMCCHQFLLEPEPTLRLAEETIGLASAKGFPNWLLAALALRGWSLANLGRLEEGLALVGQAIGLWRGFGAGLVVPYFLALHADVLRLAGRPNEALALLDEALEVGERNNDHWYEAETHRLRGACLLAVGRREEAEAALGHAVDVAERQGAELLAVRAVADRARLRPVPEAREAVAVG